MMKIAGMQLLHNNHTVLMAVKDNNMQKSSNRSIRDTSANMEVKEKRSSNGSLLVMNPVASGDNVATGLSTHKLKEELPPLVPCCEGRVLQINEEIVRSGLSAISLKHDGVMQCVSSSRASERVIPPGLIKHRNSFRNLHRPDLKRVPYLRRLTPVELEMLFKDYAADLHTRVQSMTGTVDGPTQEVQSVYVNKPSKEGGANAFSLESESRSEDVPIGMRLHGTRARLYTSVLAGAKSGDQADGNLSTHEEYDIHVPEDPIAEDEVQLHEELQIILPPRYDDVTTDHSTTSSTI